MELGAGIGRASVNFFLKFILDSTKFYLLDGDSGDKQIAGLNPVTKKDFYNSIEMTECYCKSNNLTNYELINIEKDSIPDVQLDLVYSLASIGFHWHLNLYLEQLIDYTKSGTLLLFQIRNKKEWIDELILYIRSLSVYDVVSMDSDEQQENLKIMVLMRK